jgi:hypothetical protein
MILCPTPLSLVTGTRIPVLSRLITLCLRLQPLPAHCASHFIDEPTEAHGILTSEGLGEIYEMLDICVHRAKDAARRHAVRVRVWKFHMS